MFNSTCSEVSFSESTESDADSERHGYFDELFSRAQMENSTGDNARSQIKAMAQKIKKLEAKFKQDAVEKNDQREMLEVVLRKLSVLGGEIEAYKVPSPFAVKGYTFNFLF